MGPIPLYQRALAAGALIVVAPILVAAALVVRTTSSGSALYRQRRVGIFGAPITVIKLRTMRSDASSASTATTATDARITPTGRWLRRYKIDELPQLWCVVRGDLAIVGPRPDVAEVIDALPAQERQQLLKQQPGITGIASLYFRDEATLLEAVSDPDRFSSGPLIEAKTLLNTGYAAKSTWRDDIRVIAWTIRDDPDAVAALAERVAPGYRDAPPFRALDEHAPGYAYRGKELRVHGADEKNP